MKAYRSFGVSRELKGSEVLILVAIISMYSGVFLAVLAKLLH